MTFFFGGDFRFFFPENIGNFATLPSAWDNILNTGIGQSQLGSLWITSYLNLTAFISKLGIPWELISLLFWVIPSIVISFQSTFALFNFLFKNGKFAILSGLIYSLNTYFLMILTGGQLGVSIGYSLAPLVLLTFLRLFKNPNLQNSIIMGFALGLQVLFDPRLTYITVLILVFYSLFNFWEIFSIVKKSYLSFFVVFIIPLLFNSFWILPLLITRTSAIPNGFNDPNGFKFFSFADFSHSLSLLHPNWPENIFGKTYFLRWEFLFLPILAFSSLLFKTRKTILFFVLLSLIGVFLAKGANDPFGVVNSWIFQRIPGMSMFRDPTKWYLLIAFSYSILIPFSLLELSKKYKLQNLIFAGFYIYFVFLSFPIFQTNTFKLKSIPKEYVQLKNFLYSQKDFSRTLWIPEWQRFGYFDNNHPAIGRYEIFRSHDSHKMIAELKKDKELLSDLGVRYVIVPYDSVGEIFISDRKYDDKEYQKTLSEVGKIDWLKPKISFGKIKVFETNLSKDHFWSSSPSLKVTYEFLKSTEYKINIQNAKKGDLLVFSEGFDKNWVLQGSGQTVQSSKFELFNSFVLPKDGNYEAKVYYSPQNYVNFGLVLSILTLFGSLGYLASKLKKW